LGRKGDEFLQFLRRTLRAGARFLIDFLLHRLLIDFFLREIHKGILINIGLLSLRIEATVFEPFYLFF
jgi:hypothetical protein